jgi:hypothetical protein
MAVAVQTIKTKSVVTGTNLAIDKPTGLASGDLMVVFCDDLLNSTIAPPADWNTIYNQSDTNQGIKVAVFWKIATAGDAAASTFTFTRTDGTTDYPFSGGMYRITGHHATTPIGANSFAQQGNTATPVYTGVTPPANSLLLIYTMKSGGGTTGSYAIATSNPASWTEAWDFVAGVGGASMLIASAYASRPESSATGNASLTFSNSNYSSGGIIAIQPPAAAGPANLKSYNTNLKANIKSINTNLLANIKSLDTNV